jgi:hypothetical protein
VDGPSPGRRKKLVAGRRCVNRDVAAGETFARDLRRTQFLPTRAEKYLWVRKSWNGTVKVNDARGIAADGDASHGVIHVINCVLIPHNFTISTRAGAYDKDSLDAPKGGTDTDELPPTEFTVEYLGETL